MSRVMRSCLQSLLKLLNSLIAMVGIGMIMYAVWLIWVWQERIGDLPLDDPSPWFIYTFLGIGLVLCLITCSGHIDAETTNGCCLSFYMMFICLLFVLEAGVTADVFLHHNWEEDFPVDPSGSFDEFKGFVNSNFEICKWISLSIIFIQGLCLLLSMLFRAIGPHQYYDSDDDDDYDPETVPLLKNAAHPYNYPASGTRNDAWNIRANEKGSIGAAVELSFCDVQVVETASCRNAREGCFEPSTDPEHS